MDARVKVVRKREEMITEYLFFVGLSVTWLTMIGGICVITWVVYRVYTSELRKYVRSWDGKTYEERASIPARLNNLFFKFTVIDYVLVCLLPIAAAVSLYVLLQYYTSM